MYILNEHNDALPASRHVTSLRRRYNVDVTHRRRIPTPYDCWAQGYRRLKFQGAYPTDFEAP